MIKMPWDIKYSPKSLEEYIFNDENMKEYFTTLDKIPHLLFSGTSGTGKTTLAKLLVSRLNIDELDVMLLNASDENGVDVIREKIKNFIMTPAYGDYKVVICDEADYLTLASQAVLRSLMLEYADNASFIFTCNYDNKMMPAIKSRCKEFKFKASDHLTILELIATILVEEDIKFKVKELKKYINGFYPDIRKIIVEVEKNCINGELLPFNSEIFDIVNYIQHNDWSGLRNDLNNMKDIDYNSIYESLYKNLDRCEKFSDVEKYEDGIVIIAEYVSNNSSMPMLNLISCIIELGRI